MLSRDLSSLAPPDQLADWRLVLTYEAASRSGVLGALPGTLGDLAARCELAEGALRAVLDQLAAWEYVTVDAHGRYSPGPAAPAWPHDRLLLTHATALRRWAALLEPRLSDRTAIASHAPTSPMGNRTGQDTLAHQARRLTGSVVDACLRQIPEAKRALDLGGGHGEFSLELARRGVRTTLQDRAEVIEAAGRLSATGIELFAGDFFTTLPDGPFDLVLCSTVTNMFDAARNVDLYRRLRPLIAPGGGLAIVSYLRDRTTPPTPTVSAFALQMLVWTDGGDAHGESEYRAWLTEAEYGVVHVHDLLDPPQSIVFAER